MSQAELVARFAAGEPGSVAEVYKTYGRLVYTVSQRVLGDAGLAEDATRRTFLNAWRLAASFDPSHTFGPWLETIAGQTAADIYRRNREHRHLDGVAATEPEPASPVPAAQRIHDVWLVRRAIDTLSDQDRELIRLQHQRQLTQAEIADRLGIPVGSVKSRSHRAHHRLAGLLGELRAADAPCR